jgi:hypothetical protein
VAVGPTDQRPGRDGRSPEDQPGSAPGPQARVGDRSHGRRRGEVSLNRLFASGTVTIEASATEVFEVVSDPVIVAGLAEEAVAVGWLAGATQAALGARFKGFNRNGWRRWRTICHIVFEEGRRFAYDVNAPVMKLPISRWQYETEPAGDGTCTVTETSWARVPLWFVPAAMLITGVFDRPACNTANITTTLGRLKTYIESRPHHRPAAENAGKAPTEPGDLHP